MLTILDGRKNFFQWDTEQKLIVSDELVKEIHFSNAVTNPALVCEVFEEDGNRVVNVPNILLQQDWNIKAYGCCDLCVRQYAEFEVIRRNKPADYVYTETEIKRYEDLEARIEELEKNGGGTGGGGAVASVNGKVGEVELKAADVGAVPTSRTINSKPLSNNITLNASDIGAIGLSGGTLTGSLNIGSTSNTNMYSVYLRKKVDDTQYVTGSLAMNGSDLRIQNSVSTKRSGSTTTYTTTSNSVVISDSETSVSKPILFTTPTAKDDTRDSLSVYSKAEVEAAISEATKEDEWELIEEITINEEYSSIKRTEANIKALYILVDTPAGEVTGNANCMITTEDGNKYYSYLQNILGTNNTRAYIYFESKGNKRIMRTAVVTKTEGREDATTPRAIDYISETYNTKIVTYDLYRSGSNFREGTTIQIWGVRA